jgi:predicted transcriptional regulator
VLFLLEDTIKPSSSFDLDGGITVRVIVSNRDNGQVLQGLEAISGRTIRQIMPEDLPAVVEATIEKIAYNMVKERGKEIVSRLL